MSQALMGPQAAAQQALHGSQGEEWLIAATIAGATPANTVTAAVIQRQAGIAAVAQVFCPVRELWNVERIYYVGTDPTPDVQIQLMVDFVVQPYTPLASSVNLAQNRPAALTRTIFVSSGSVVSANMINIAVVGSAAITVLFRVHTQRFSP